MQAFEKFFSPISSVVKVFGISDFIDIVLISYIIYKAIKLVRETRAEQLVKGIFLLVISYFISSQFGLKTTTFLLKNVFQIGIIALIVLFQPEIRRALEKVGRSKVTDLSMFSNENKEEKAQIWNKAIDIICESVGELSKTKTGALIVIEQKTKLGEQIDTGVELNATITKELIGNIFFVNTPLHDGAMIIRDAKIIAAACFLPKPQKEDFIASNLGSRHRAAIGISEISDAITIIVSEETGTISVSFDGKLIRHFTSESLKTYLTSKLVPIKDTEEVNKHKVFRRTKKK